MYSRLADKTEEAASHHLPELVQQSRLTKAQQTRCGKSFFSSLLSLK
jgi:hypothetical protein